MGIQGLKQNQELKQKISYIVSYVFFIIQEKPTIWEKLSERTKISEERWKELYFKDNIIISNKEIYIIEKLYWYLWQMKDRTTFPIGFRIPKEQRKFRFKPEFFYWLEENNITETRFSNIAKVPSCYIVDSQLDIPPDIREKVLDVFRDITGDRSLTTSDIFDIVIKEDILNEDISK